MNRIELYYKSLNDPNRIVFTLHNTYDGYLQKEYLRILGTDLSPKKASDIITDVYNRLSEFPMDCDVSLLVFDCLRKEVLIESRKVDEHIDVGGYVVTQESRLDSLEKESQILLEIVLPLLSKKQLQYFFDRYYFFRHVKVNRRYESLIYRLFMGKGIASARFEHFKVVPKTNVTEDMYATWLTCLDFSCLELSDKGTVAEFINQQITIPIFLKVWERQYFISKYSLITLGVLVFVIVVCVSFCCII